MNVYLERWGDSPLLDDWQDEADRYAVGDFLKLGYDQVMYWNRDPQSGSGRVMIVDYSGDEVPQQPRYLERWGDSPLLDDWQDEADRYAVGDFLKLGYDQVMYWNRDPQSGSGRVMIVDYSGDEVPQQPRYLERWGDSPLLDGWQDEADRYAVGDFLELGYDQVMYWNRDPQSGSGRVMIVDYSGDEVPQQPRYLERWGDSPLLDDWQDEADRYAVGDFLKLGYDQVMYWNRDPQSGSGRVMIVDYSGDEVPQQPRYLERWGDSPLLDGWQDEADRYAVGDFLKLGYDQVMYWNRDPQSGSGRVMIVDYSGDEVPQQPRYLERWGDSPLLDGWQDEADRYAVGDFLKLGYDQVMYWNRDPQSGSGRVMIVDYSGDEVPQQPRYLERWGDSPLLDGWQDEADRYAVGDYAYDTGDSNAVALDDAVNNEGQGAEVHEAKTDRPIVEDYPYDTGDCNAVALAWEGQVVEVHVADGTLFCRVGRVDYTQQAITWGDNHSYGAGDSNAVALDDAVNNEGKGVEVHVTDGTLFCQVGRVDYTQQKIAWGDSHPYGTGDSNAVALDNGGNVVEVHVADGTLFCRVGRVDYTQQAIAWGDSHPYGTGDSNAVALDDAVNNGGNVVEVHVADGTLFCQVGRVDYTQQKIAWGDSHPYGTGDSNAVALDDKGNVVEVHATADRLFFRFGTVDYAQQAIAWGDSHLYGTGSSNAVALNRGNVVEVHATADRLFYWVGTVDYTKQTTGGGPSM